MKDNNRAKTERERRYKKRLLMMLKSDFFNVYILTFTFNEKTLSQTNSETRLRYIKDFLIKQTKTYILNIDYGKTNEREHYHAIAINKYKIINYDAYKYGYIDAMKLYKYTRQTNEQIADNLTAHAFKETTRNNKIIYSRKQTKRNSQFRKAINKRLTAWNSAQEQQNKSR